MEPAVESAIREAVATGAYAEANRLLAGYCQQFETPDELLRAGELLEWMLQRTLAGRAYDATRLKELCAAIQYRQIMPDRLHTWQLDG